ncbi:hypothetical protein [Gynuella sunshinyii]|uniref:hypothetical protein n=1 Tax=Gynuella sunshinyii TaxID=1445505 RepID=UPI001FE02E77|nr:hypothetical protein [Gynuella sunshinyii]
MELSVFNTGTSTSGGGEINAHVASAAHLAASTTTTIINQGINFDEMVNTSLEDTMH